MGLKNKIVDVEIVSNDEEVIEVDEEDNEEEGESCRDVWCL